MIRINVLYIADIMYDYIRDRIKVGEFVITERIIDIGK